MLFPVAGTRFFIADNPTDPDLMAPETAFDWIEIGETEAFGTLGAEFELQDFHDIGGRYLAAKGSERPTVMQVVLGLDPSDPGQALLLAAYRHNAAFPFRMLFPDGLTERRWFALVVHLGEVFDAANNVMRMQAELHPVSQIQR